MSVLVPTLRLSYRESALLVHTRAFFRAKPTQRFAGRTESTPSVKLSMVLYHRRSQSDDFWVTLLHFGLMMDQVLDRMV